MRFLLSRPHGRTTASTVDARFDRAQDAVAAISAARRAGRRIAVVGALSFDAGSPERIHPDALYAVADLSHSGTDIIAPQSFSPSVSLLQSVPAPAVHRDRVARVIERIAAGEASKVVLARTLRLRADEPLDVDALVAALAATNPERNAFRVDLDAAGPTFLGHTLVGASPESLVRKVGDTVTCHPYAGSAARSTDPTLDAQRAESLLDSAKDRHEHRIVVEHIREALAPIAAQLSVPDEPVLLSTGEMWHLATPIEARLRDGSLSALDLALRLHPTPAVCGTPTAVARHIITEVEEPRGFYAGAVGWCDEAGDGEWMVSIRCLELDADRQTMSASAGGGIVAASDPAAELAETGAKFATVLRALGCPDLLRDEA
ncbi:isochorismate synthase MenF [Williamsia sp. CHRR-6]|uniref:isochorismate synthase n=1 Tax=Williamsia sp. CHRR-6 TaxID=2835871 RepID=UPI001BDA689C|nr:isochorismate synthase [Williamsia sp. CHRR-6]MBT0566160.1 isochorismate synthase [Williamsia sp. CHRR-6]